MATTPPGDGFWDGRRARRIVPLAFITYSLAYLDKSNYSIGAAGGMVHDLRLSSGLNALIAASFFLGYFLFQIPGTVYAERHSVRRLQAHFTHASVPRGCGSDRFRAAASPAWRPCRRDRTG